MIVQSGGRDVQIRASGSWPGAWPYSSQPPSELVGGALLGGAMLTTLERAIGLPALLGILLRIGQGVGLAPLKVYRGQAPTREVAGDTWQYELLHNRPSSECWPAAFFGDLAASVAGVGYSPLRKYKTNGRRGPVRELHVMDATKVTPKRSGGRLVFEDRTEGQTVVRDQTEILCVRGLALGGGAVGFSPISAARLGIITALKRQMFEYQYFRNNAEARVAISFPQNVKPAQAKEWKELWNEEHQGEENWHSTSVMGGGATITHLPVTMADAQFVEANAMTAEQMGGIYSMPKVFLNIGENSPTDQDWRILVTLCFGWIFTAISQSFTHDRDLFPIEPDPRRRLMAEHTVDALLRPDLKTRYEAYKAARQAGWMTSNEIRALENMPPHPDGDKLQVIPVGGGEPRREQLEGLLSELEDIAASASLEDGLVLSQVLERGRAQLEYAG